MRQLLFYCISILVFATLVACVQVQATPSALATPTVTIAPGKLAPTVIATSTLAVSATETVTLVTPTSQATNPVGTIQVGEDDNGKTVSVPKGSKISIVLHSTYWEFQGSSNPQVVSASGRPIVAADPQLKIRGIGIGTVTLNLEALSVGQAQVTASRTTCGEALLCAENQKTFNVTIYVH